MLTEVCVKSSPEYLATAEQNDAVFSLFQKSDLGMIFEFNVFLLQVSLLLA